MVGHLEETDKRKNKISMPGLDPEGVIVDLAATQTQGYFSF